MPSEELLRRLEALNRKPLENVPTRPVSESDRGASLRKRLARQRDKPGERGMANAGVAGGEYGNVNRAHPSILLPPHTPLEACLPGAIRVAPGGRLYYHIQQRLTDHAPWSETLGAELGETLNGEAMRTHLCRTTGVPAERTLFLDLETLGLSRSDPLFLVGALRVGPDGAVACHQLLARDLAEEPGTVAAFAEMLCEARLLVTFNGKAFDLPMLRERAAFHGIALPHAPAHLDVLVEARHRFRRRLPNCRLLTLEQRICGRTREGDIPGAEIPRAYREFVRSGDAARLAIVAQHNLLDLATTADLLIRLWK